MPSLKVSHLVPRDMCREPAKYGRRPFRGRYVDLFGLYGVRMGMLSFGSLSQRRLRAFL